MVQPPTKQINISTRQSGLWDCKPKEERDQLGVVNEKRPDSVLRTQRPSVRNGPDSTPKYETIRRDRTRPYTMRPSEETGLNSLIRDRQKRPDSIRSSRTFVVARQPLAMRDQSFCSPMFVEQPLYAHWRCPQCNARDGSQPSRLHLTYPRQPRV